MMIQSYAPATHKSAPESIDAYRDATRRMTVFVLPKTQVCPCCNKPRSHTQFIAKSRFCEACRRPR